MTLTIYETLEQGTDAWLEARRGILTASQIGKMLTWESPDALTVACPRCSSPANDPCVSAARKIPTPIKTVHEERSAVTALMPKKLIVADNDTSATLINTLAAERITGHVEYVHPTFDMQRGHDDEPFARDAYAAHKGVDVDEIGFAVLENNGHRLGYSPDGLVGADGLIEIKSRKPHSHLALLLNGGIPHMHMAQMQTGMYVMGREWCDYVGYSGGLPLHLEHVTWEPRWFEAIQAAHTAFEERITAVINQYNTAVEGLPMTERRPDFEDIF